MLITTNTKVKTNTLDLQISTNVNDITDINYIKHYGSYTARNSYNNNKSGRQRMSSSQHVTQVEPNSIHLMILNFI